MKQQQRELSAIMNRLFNSHRKSYLQQSQAHGLYVGQPQLLNYIRNHPGCTQNEIAQGLGVSPASIAFSAKRLQANGFLQKVINNLDMRCNQLYVTPEGNKVLDDFESSFDELNEHMFDGFSEEELQQFEIFSERIVQNLENFTKEKEKEA